MPVNPAEVKSLFLEAAEIDDPAARAALLRERAGADSQLLARVNALLAANDQTRSSEAAPSRLNLEAGNTASPIADSPGKDERVGTVIADKYKLVERIGDGGMGSVWLAQQTEPVKRNVAIKLIKLGMDSRQVLARFDAERQALAMMDHPNIAKVLDGGLAPDGRPYFVMELVKGFPITEYCDNCKLGLKERLELFVPVCQAIQHAHQKGIIHRDIKPSNVLIAMYDDRAVPKVIDFGVAKATGQQLTLETLNTPFGGVIGTPQYMSPEQATFNNIDIDTRSDVYSLGVLLYELLSGSPPFSKQELEKKGLVEMLRVVREEEPPRPSNKLSTAATLPTLSANRGTEPKKLTALLRSELDWIVLKAVEKKRARRYDTANGLAADVLRYLAGEPVVAHPPSTAYRFKKFIRRNRVVVSAGGAVAAALLIGLIAFAWQANIANQSAMQAKQSQQEAERSRGAAQDETYRALLSEVIALRAGHEPGWRETALDDLTRLATMPTTRRDLPELRTEAAATLATPDIRLVARFGIPWGDVWSFTFSPDRQTLLTAADKTGLDFWDVASNRHHSFVSDVNLAKGGFRLSKVVFLPDGKGIALGTSDRGVVFTDFQGVQMNRTPITEGSSQPIKLTTSANGSRIAVSWSGGAGTTVHDVTSGTLLQKFNDNDPDVVLSPDGKWLAHHESTGIVLLPIDSRETRLTLQNSGGVTALAFSPNGTVIAGVRDNTAVLWDLSKREQFCILRGHRERVLDVAFSPDGEWIATGGMDYTTRIWETRTGQNVVTLPSAASPAFEVKWSPTGEYLAVRMNNALEVDIYKVIGRRRVQQWLTGHKVELKCVVSNPRLEQLATSGYFELISWDLTASLPSGVTIGPNPGLNTSIAFSQDGSLLAHCSGTAIIVRDGKSGKILTQFPVPFRVDALAFDSTGKRIAYGDHAGNVVVWNIDSNSAIQKFNTRDLVWSIVYLDNPPCLVTNSSDAVLLLNVESGKLERTIDLPGGRVRSLTADRARTRLMVGQENGAISVFSLPDLTPGVSLDHAHEGEVLGMAVSPDGRLMASGGAERRVVLRDATSLETLLRFPLWNGGKLTDLTFDSKGHRLAIVGTASDVDLWDLPALRDGLTALGLGWDSPPAAVVPTRRGVPDGERFRSDVSVIHRPGTADPAAFEQGSRPK
jgi:serine/threonine protein kinase/WD40 repeat protein